MAIAQMQPDMTSVVIRGIWPEEKEGTYRCLDQAVGACINDKRLAGMPRRKVRLLVP